MSRRWWRLIPAAAALGVDAASKAWARSTLSHAGTVWLWRPWLSLRLVYNAGATLGVGADHSRLITLLSALAVGALVVLVLRCDRGSAGLVLMLGGAAGNLSSRLSQGAVTDFIHVRFWPGIFNLADVFLRVGAVLLAWSIFQGELGMGGHEALRRDRPVPGQGMVAEAERSGDGR